LEKSARSQALERIPRFGEKKPNYSAPAPSRFLAKSPQMLGNFQAHLGLYLFETIEEAQQIATEWLWTYNHERPNMGIGGITPAQKLQLAA
jgi:transposase InsO family protein